MDCFTCGACCREAFDSVPVADDDEAMLAKHPHLVVSHDDGWRDLARVPSTMLCGTRCAALQGDGSPNLPFHCVVYAERPTACAELERGSESCLFARRRVGLSADPAKHVAARGPRQ